MTKIGGKAQNEDKIKNHNRKHLILEVAEN